MIKCLFAYAALFKHLVLLVGTDCPKLLHLSWSFLVVFIFTSITSAFVLSFLSLVRLGPVPLQMPDEFVIRLWR